MVVSNNIFLPLNGSNTTYIDSVMNMTDSALQRVNEGAGFEGLFDECKDIVSTTGQKVPGTTRGLKDHVLDILWGGVQSTTFTTLRQTAIIDAFAISPILKTILNLGLTTINIPITVMLIYNIIILLVCAYASFKLFVTMFTTYIKIFMNVILAPFQLLAGSMPGNSSALMNWFKSVFANVLVFPAIFIVINFAVYLGENIKETTDFNFFGNSGAIWPSFIANLKGVILVGAYIFCSNLPGVINGFLKVGESKEIASAGESTKKALGKLPLIGGMFG